MPSATFTTGGTWTVPLTADPATVAVYATGEGGNSATSVSASHSGAGGGGGAFAGETNLGGLKVGSVLSFTIGQGGQGVNTVVTGAAITVTAAFGTTGSGITAGLGGAAGANSIAFAGGNGGAGASAASRSGGAGGGSAGSTGAGGAGASSSGSGATTGGTAGTGAAGPPSLAGAAGAGGGSSAQGGNNGIAPGSGAGGPGDGASHAAATGAPGQVVITWSTLNGVGFPAALITIGAFNLTPSPSSLKVTATAGGSAVNGLLLRVRVLDNAALPTALNTGTQTGTATQAADVALTPAATGSLAYSVATIDSGSPAAAAGNTAVDSVATHGTFVSTATLTANTPFTAGSSSTPATGGCAALEVTKFGGTISTNASSPAVVNATGATAATTAAFAPPTGGKLILALVSAMGGSGQVTMAVSDSFGLTWTQAVAADAAGNDYAGIWYAYTPANLTPVGIAPPPGVVGTAYSYQLTVTGGYRNYGWSVASGSLPAGLSLNGSTGIISGTPTTPGMSSFTLTVGDGFGNTATTGTISLVVNEGTTPGGVILNTWSGAAAPYSYGTLGIPVANADHGWLFVSVSWADSGEQGVAYVTDDAHNIYEPCAFASTGVNQTEIFCVPNARPAGNVYVSTSAYVRWLTACVLDVSGLQPGFTVDATPAAVSGGPGTVLNLSLSTTQPDFILAAGAFRGTPGTVTPSGSGASWTTIGWGGINGSSGDGLTQAVAWAETSGSATPAMTFTAGASGTYSGCMVAVYRNGGLPVNPNPAWPVIKCQAAFGYQPYQPVTFPVWTDITSRFRGLKGGHGRNFELDEISAGDVTITLDNFDGGLSPQNSASPYFPNVTLITPVRLTATWQGRTYPLFRGIIQAIPQTYDFQRGMVEVTAADDWSNLPQTLLAQSMIQEMLYDQPLHLWPANEQQGALGASNWSGRSAQSLTPTAATLTAPVQTGGGTKPASQLTFNLFGVTINVDETAPPLQVASFQQQLWAIISGSGSASTASTASPGPPPTPATPTTGFGNSVTATWPSGLAGTTDSAWGNTTTLTAANYYQGSVLADSADTSLPLLGSTWSVWAQMYYVPSNANAVIMDLTDLTGGTVYLKLSYDGTNITAAQSAGSQAFSPPSYLFDSKWHMWTVTISATSVVTVKLDGVTLGSYTATFPSGTPTMAQWGGDATAASASTAGIYTGLQYLAGVYDRVVDDERILTWARSGITGFLNELAGQRIQRILTWARWGAPQAVDQGTTMQQQFNYLGSGYASNGLSGSVGNFATAGGAIGAAGGAQADATIQDVSASENGGLVMGAGGEITFRQRGNPGPGVGIALGDMDYALNTWQEFEPGLGPWTAVSSCTVAQSAGWSYEGARSALVTVTGTPVQAYAWGDSAKVAPLQGMGFSCWVMSPQGCTVNAAIDFFNAGSGYISTANTAGITIPPMTPVFLNLTGVTAPGGAATAFPHPTIISSPATGTQLYFDHPRLSPAGFQASYGDGLQVVEDVQYLYNDIVITRNVDQAGYRARDAASRLKYRPRVYTRTVYTSADDPQAVVNVASDLLTDFSQPQLRVTQLVVDAAAQPENWPFVLSAGIGDLVNFSRTPAGGAAVTGTFTVLHVEPELGPDKATFTYILAPNGFS